MRRAGSGGGGEARSVSLMGASGAPREVLELRTEREKAEREARAGGGGGGGVQTLEERFAELPVRPLSFRSFLLPSIFIQSSFHLTSFLSPPFPL